MADVTITSKRQATLPADLCKDLGVKPGDRLRIQRQRVGGRDLWVIHGKKPDWSWFGAARRHTKKKSHRWSDIERSVERGWHEHRD